MFDLSVHNILHSNLFNFILLVIILYSLTAPFLKKSVKSANEKMTNIVSNSVQCKEKAIQNLEQAKNDYAHTPKEKEEIAQIAQNTIASLKRKAHRDTEEAKKIIRDNLNKSVRTEEAKISEQLTKETTEKSVNTALEKIKNQLLQDETLHDKLIEQAIEELETI